MNAAMVNRALRAVEMGEAGVTEAEVLRQALAEMEVQRVAASGAGTLAREQLVQYQVLAAVTARGYRDGWSNDAFLARQVGKAVEELGKLAELFDFEVERDWQLDLWKAQRDARREFDHYPMVWQEAELAEGVGMGRVMEEVADVLIPLLCLAEAAGLDALEAVRRKAIADVGRGRR